MESDLVGRNCGFRFTGSKFLSSIIGDDDKALRKKFRELGNVSTAIIGRPYNCIAIHPHEELVIFEILQQYPEKTLGEVLDKLYEETGSQYACSTRYYYLKRNYITLRRLVNLIQQTMHK
jgi:hypothetical protein